MSRSGYGVLSTFRNRGVALSEHVVTTERDTLRFRLLALVIAATSLFFFEFEQDVTDRAIAPAVGIAVAYLVYTLLIGRAIIPRVLPRMTSGAASIYLVLGITLVDAVALTTMLYLCGGPRSVALILIPLFVIYHSIYLGYLSGLLSATLFSLCYFGFSFVWGESAFVTSSISFQLPSFYLLAVFSGYVAERRLKEHLEKEELQQLVRLQSQDKETTAAEGTTTDLDSVLNEVIAASSRLTGLPQCLVTLLDDQHHRLAGRAGNVDLLELNLNSLDELVFHSDESAATALALRTGQPVLIADATEDVHRLPIWAQYLGMGTMLVLPLSAGGRNWGAMYLFNIGMVQPVSRDRVSLARGYANLAARAIASTPARQTST